MAGTDEAKAALLDALVSIASKAKAASVNQPGSVEAFASAARQLAKAHALLADGRDAEPSDRPSRDS